MRRNFTLLEMMVVMAIAMIMMGLIASGYQKVKQGQNLSIAANTVQGALQSARSQAMQLNTVVYAYFLDGGKYDWDFGLMDTNSSGAASPKTSDTADGYLRAYTAYDVPYDVWLVTKDGADIAHNPLPNGAAWVSLGFGAGTDASSQTAAYKQVPASTTDTRWKYSVDPGLTKGLGRNCSLIIAFTPSGTAWPITATAREMTTAFYVNTLTNIRIYLLDELIGTPSPSSITAASTAPFVPLTDLWASGISESSLSEVTYKADLNGDGDMTDTSVAVDLNGDGDTADSFTIYNTPHGATNPAKMKWLTIKMNYVTGLSSIVDGLTGE